MDVIEIVFYVHGVSPDTRGASHSGEYETMHTGITDALGDQSLWPREFGGAEWGWNYDAGAASSHKALADAQRIFGSQVIEAVKAPTDLTPNPLRPAINMMRKLVLHGFGDMFYYVSTEGKWAVRYEVARQLAAHVRKIRGKRDVGVSLTLLGHSAGSVIAFDFLYYLFGQGTYLQTSNSKFATKSRRVQAEKGLDDLRVLVRAGKLRLRKLITFGSPISMLMFRSDALVNMLAQKKLLTPKAYGLESEIPGHRLDSGKPRWINLWDKDDPIAWPVEPIMNSDTVEDVYVDVSDLILPAHNEYWASKKCAREIAARWE